MLSTEHHRPQLLSAQPQPAMQLTYLSSTRGIDWRLCASGEREGGRRIIAAVEDDHEGSAGIGCIACRCVVSPPAHNIIGTREKEELD